MLKKIKNIAFVIGLGLISNVSLGQQNDDCGNLEPICTEAGVQFTALSGVPAASTVDPGNNYDCLFSSPNPTWYYMEVGVSGNLVFDLNAGSDIDFIIYGPFADSTAAANGCGNYGNGGTGANVVDCSYLSTNFETPEITGAVAGEIYVLLITNYAATVQAVNFSQSNFGGVGAGELDCPIIQAPCVSDPGTYTVKKNGTLTPGPLYLCEGDNFELTSNNDFILPNDTIPQPVGDGIYSAQLMWLVYDAAPTSADPGADAGFTGTAIPTTNINDVNNGTSQIVQNLGCGTYWFVPVAGDDGIGGNGGIANGTTDNGGLHWDKNGNGCYLLGTPIEVTYACPINTTINLNCNPPGTINGMDIDLTGGTGNYTIINQGAGNLASTSVSNPGTATVADLYNNAAWSIDIIDAEGCTASASGTFSAPVITDVTLTPAPDCPTLGTGDVDVTVAGTSGQGAPYTIVMAGDPPTVGTTDSYSDFAGTIVPIIVADSEGCISDSTVTIPSAGHYIDVTITAINGEFCYGDGQGSATVQGIPTPSGNIVNIVWTDPLGGTFPGGPTNTTQNGMMPGIWTVCFTDDVGAGCEVCIPVEITAPQELDIFVDNSNEPVCYAFTDGSIDVGISGGSAPHTFSWSHDTGLTGDVANTIGAGTYWAYVTDDNGCQDSVEVILGQPDSLYAEFIVKHINCFGDSTGGIITTDVYNAFGNWTYNWNLQGAVPNPPTSSNVANDLPAGSYVLTILDENGCSKEYEWTLVENPPIVFVEFKSEPAYCRLFDYQNGNGVVSAAAAGGVPDYTYQWVNLTDPDTTTNTTWGGQNPGLFQMTVTDDLGCTLVQTIQIDSVNPIADFTVISAELDANLEGTAPVNVNLVNQSQYFANPNNPQADTTFFWNLNHDNVAWYISHDWYEELDTVYTGEEIYEICLVAINKNGCTDTTCKDIIVHEVPDMVPPNIFTPGVDGANDEFQFLLNSQGVDEFTAVIVDRWGQKVFEFNAITDTWNGDNANGKPCNDGVYFYTYEVVYTNGTTGAGQGTVQLLRE
jgi:gliding motility-associated-like protein